MAGQAAQGAAGDMTSVATTSSPDRPVGDKAAVRPRGAVVAIAESALGNVHIAMRT